jgi:hypothetical protein
MKEAFKIIWIGFKWALFVVEIIVGSIGFAINWVSAFKNNHNQDNPISWWLLLPIIFHILFTINNVYLFSVSYSILGYKKRTPTPKEPICFEEVSWTKDLYFHYWSFIKWSFYPTGIEINFIPLGRAFIPWEMVTSIETYKRGYCVVNHNSPELQSPLKLPVKLTDLISLGLSKNCD